MPADGGNLSSELAVDALEQAPWERQEDSTGGLIHHGDRGVKYQSIRHTERLPEAGIEPSGGSRADRLRSAL